MLRYFKLENGTKEFYSNFNGIYVTSDTYLNAPLIDYTEYQIPSRDGSVIQYNKRFNNVVRKLDCYINDRTDVNAKLDILKKFLYTNTGYLKITTNYDDDGYFQYGYLAEELNVEPFNMGMTANFSLYFSCLPFKFTNGSDTTKSLSGSMTRNIINDSNNMIKTLKNNSSFNVASKVGMYFITTPSNAYGENVNVTLHAYGRNGYMAIYDYDETNNEHTFVVDGMYDVTATYTTTHSNTKFVVLTPINDISSDLQDNIGRFTLNLDVNSDNYQRVFYIHKNIKYINNKVIGFELLEDGLGILYSLNDNATLTDSLSNIYYLINGQTVYFDVNSFVNDYTDAYIRNNLLYSYTASQKYLFLNIDFNNCLAKLHIDNGYFDISKYVHFYGSLDNKQNEISIAQVNTLTNNYLLDNPKVWLFADWWKI